MNQPVLSQQDQLVMELMETHGGGDKVFALLQVALYKCMTDEQRNQWFEEAKQLGMA
jgi:hypothetical protein